MLSFTKKSLSLCLLAIISACLISACNDSSTGPDDEFQVETYTAEDIPANPNAERGAPPAYTFYNLEEGAIIANEDSATTQWDLGFNATSIIVNGGSSGPGEGGAIGIFPSMK